MHNVEFVLMISIEMPLLPVALLSFALSIIAYISEGLANLNSNVFGFERSQPAISRAKLAVLLKVLLILTYFDSSVSRMMLL